MARTYWKHSSYPIESVVNLFLKQNEAIVVDTSWALADTVETLRSVPGRTPSLYFDMQGDDISRHGSVSIVLVFSLLQNRTYLIDIAKLGEQAFSTPGKSGVNLRMILESEVDHKVFFDVRNDSDLLWNKFKIHLRGVQDLQLMEFATRLQTYQKQFVWGLLKCIERSTVYFEDEKRQRMDLKKSGREILDPNRGGSFAVFNERPLAPIIIAYCVNDVQIISRLWKFYDDRMSPEWRSEMLEQSTNRVELSRSASYNGAGPHMACAPETWRTVRSVRSNYSH